MPEVELSVIVPCLNEAGNLPELCARICRVFEVGGFEGELILVDDGSTDETGAILQERSAADPRIIGLRHDENRGIAAAWKTGAEAARGRLAAIMDADLQYQPEDLLRLRRALREHAVDIVQGWRSAVGREKGPRYYYSRGFNHLLNTVFSMRLRDNKSGFLICAREVLLDLLSYRGSYDFWQSFVMVAAKAKGYSHREVEILFRERKQGTSFLEKRALEVSLRSLGDVAKATWEYRLARRPAISPPAAVERERRRDLRWRTYLALFESSHWMITRDVEHYYESLKRTQWLDAAQTRQLQDEKLRRLIRHAYRNVPFHRARMQALGLTPDDIRGQDDLYKLPLLSKQEIRDHLYFDIMSEDHDKSQILEVATSGSTGEPFVCYADRAQLELRWAATLRAQEWTGYRFGDPTIRLWHQTLGLTRQQALRERLDARLSNRHFVPIFSLDDRRIEKALDLIDDVAPRLLDGYAEGLDLLARHALTGGRESRRVGAVMSSAQTLSPATREAIEKAFGCPVFDKYGSREFSGIAYECAAHAGHHVVTEAYIVEILKGGEPARPGELGEVVITDLTNRCMPFIRYRIGDLAEALPEAVCSCGRGAPRIGTIAGRVQSIILGANGRYLPGTFFSHYFKDYAHAVRRYQVVQREPGAITLRIVPAARFTPAVLTEIRAALHQHLGREMRIDVDLVDDVSMVRTGKRMTSISSLPFDLQSEPVVVELDEARP